MQLLALRSWPAAFCVAGAGVQCLLQHLCLRSARVKRN